VFLAAIILGAVVVIAGTWPWPREPQSRPSENLASSPKSRRERIANYLGEAACLECHPGESALHRRSGHARTLRLAERSPIIAWLNGKSVRDPKYPEIGWSYQVRDQRLVVERNSADRTTSLALDFGVGSGKHGVTFVAIQAENSKPEPSGIEHRLSYLPNGPRLDITPGQERSPQDRSHRDMAESATFGRPLGPDQLRACLRCHATFISTVPRNRAETSATLLPNVSCERCHGPGRDHVDAARRGKTDLIMPFGDDRVPPWVEVKLCGECHRVPPAVSPSSIRPDNPGIVRFQGVGVSMSACYAKGLDGLRCTTCHDPHDRPSSNHSHYEAACLSCHRSAAQKACPISPAAKCIDCHMPRREIHGNGIFTDHWIRKPTPPRAGPPKGEAARGPSMP
jgi:hypothetical protein